MSWLDKIYHFFLWLFGFKAGEHISDMLARQRLRLGMWWWVLVSLTLGIGILGITWLIYHIAKHKPAGGV